MWNADGDDRTKYEEFLRFIYIQVQLSRFCFDPLCMMMRFDSAEILNLVIGRERERTLGKQRPSTPFTSHMMNCVNRELGYISSSVDFFVSTWILYNPLQQYFRIIFFLLALLSVCCCCWWWGRHSETELCLVIDALLFFLSTWTFLE